MRFILKTAFFIQTVVIFLAWNIFLVLQAVYDPETRFDALIDLSYGAFIYIIIVFLPWFLVAKSSLDSGRNRIKDLHGSLKYLKENKASKEKLEYAAALYNQEIDTLDQVMGEFPTRQLAGFFFGYKKFKHASLGVEKQPGVADTP